MGVLDRFRRRRRTEQPSRGATPGAPELPGCDEVFARFFDRWCSDDDRARRPFEAARPDAEVCATPGTPAGAVAAAAGEQARDALGVVRAMADAARRDWPPPSGGAALDAEWIDAFERHWSRARVAALLDGEDPADPANRVLLTCGELGAALGEALIAISPRCEWLAGWPWWDSAVYDPRSGVRVNVFHWALKKLSATAVDGSLATKVRATGMLIENGWMRSRGVPG